MPQFAGVAKIQHFLDQKMVDFVVQTGYNKSMNSKKPNADQIATMRSTNSTVMSQASPTLA
jgi:hypothetical protein